MKLAFRFVALLMLGVLLLIAIDGYLALQRDLAIFEADMRRDAEQLSSDLNPLVSDLWRTGGEQSVLQLIQQVNATRQSIQIRWVWLDAMPDDPHGPLAARERLGNLESSRVVSLRYVDEYGNENLLTYARVATSGPRPGALELSEPATHKSAMLRRFIWRLVTVTSVTLLLGVTLVLVLGAEFVARPLHLLLDKVRRIARGDLSGPVHWRRRDEFGELATAINSMCEQLDTAQKNAEQEAAARVAAQEQLRHTDRLRTVGRLAAGIAHELGTPLNVVGGRAGMIASGELSPAETTRNAEIIKEESDRIAMIIRQLLDFARRSPPQRSLIDVRKVVSQTLDLLSPLAEKRGVTISCVPADQPLMCQIDVGQIQQVLTNLIVNAEQAMPGGGRVELEMRAASAQPPEGSDAAPGEYLLVAVRDEGQGISPADMPHLFEPFFTTKDVGEGTGLGLSIALGIVQEHGGWIEVDSEIGRGTRVTLYLPLETNE